MQEYVTFVSDMCNAIENTAKTHRFDGMAFLETQNAKNTTQQSNFYTAARTEREKHINFENKKTVVDRHSLIKAQIRDFNQLQELTKSEKQIQAHLNKLIESKPTD